MPVGKKLVVVASVIATGLTTALFFRKDASQVTAWQEADEDSPFRERVERRVAADAAWPHSRDGSRTEATPPAQRVPASTTAAISDQQPVTETQPTYEKSFNPVGALLEPIGSTSDADVVNEAPAVDADWNGGSPGPIAHRIADGDTLSKLAQLYLGADDRFLEIYELNRDVLASPDLLPIGVVLKIPPRSAPPNASPGTSPAAGLAPVTPLGGTPG